MVAIVQMAVGIQRDQLLQAKEDRDERRAQRYQAELDRRREAVRQSILHLRRGMARWRWREQARAFLAVAKEQAAVRSITSPEFQRWLAWAERYEDRGLEEFFSCWEEQPADADG